MTTTTTRDYPATEPTINYVQDLLAERDLTASPKFRELTASMDESEVNTHLARLRQKARSMTQAQASAWIDRLKVLPKKHVATVPQRGATPKVKSDVPAGHYAVTGEDGTTDFYRVDRPADGRWAGYIFVQLQLSETYQRVPLRNIQTILDKIAKDGPEQASKRYGKELGRCGVCNRTLTNNESIEAGIGPVCAAKHNWSL